MKPNRITGALGFWHSANYDKSSYHFLSKKKEWHLPLSLFINFWKGRYTDHCFPEEMQGVLA
jgi:hypothetical protein